MKNKPPRRIVPLLAQLYQDVGGYESIGVKTWEKLQVELLDALLLSQKEIERLRKRIKKMDQRP